MGHLVLLANRLANSTIVNAQILNYFTAKII